MKKMRTLLPAFVLLLAGSALAGEPININTADAQALAAAINGAGPKRAEAIVAYRKKNGPFKSVDELTKVPGIGEKSVEKSRANLTTGQ